MSQPLVIVTGASSIIGRPLIAALSSKGYKVVAVTRSMSHIDGVDAILDWDLTQPLNNQNKAALLSMTQSDQKVTLVHCAPIWFLANRIAELANLNVSRIIAFSSTSVEGKSTSKDKREQEVVSLLNKAEQQVQQQSTQESIDWTIFRPTMIYGYGQGQNLAFIAKLVQRYGVFPIVTDAVGLRAPVHVGDLVIAVCQSIDELKTHNKTYNLAGGEVMSYHDMVLRIFSALGKKPVMPALPLFIYRFAIQLLNGLARLSGKRMIFSTAMISRMRINLNFSAEPAERDFGYQPGKFLPNGKSDLIENKPCK